MPNKADWTMFTQIPLYLGGHASCAHSNSLALKLLKRRGDFESMPSELYERDGEITG